MPTRDELLYGSLLGSPTEDAIRTGIRAPGGLGGSAEQTVAYETARQQFPQQIIPWYEHGSSGSPFNTWITQALASGAYVPIYGADGTTITGYRPTDLSSGQSVYMVGNERLPEPGEWGYDPSMADQGGTWADVGLALTLGGMGLAGGLTAAGATAGAAGAPAAAGITTTPIAPTVAGAAVPVGEGAAGGLTAGEVLSGGSAVAGAAGSGGGSTPPPTTPSGESPGLWDTLTGAAGGAWDFLTGDDGLAGLFGGGGDGTGALLGGLIGALLGDEDKVETETVTTGPGALTQPGFESLVGTFNEQFPGLYGDFQSFLQNTAPGVIDPTLQAFGEQINAPATLQAQLPSYLNAIYDPFIQQFNRQVMPGIAGRAIESGGMGGSRQGVAQGLAAGELSRNLGNLGLQAQMELLRQGLATQGQALQQAPSMLNLAAFPTTAPLSFLGEGANFLKQVPGSTQTTQNVFQGPGTLLGLLGGLTSGASLGNILAGSGGP